MICDDAGGGRPLRRGISAEYVRFKTGRIVLPEQSAVPGQNCAALHRIAKSLHPGNISDFRLLKRKGGNTRLGGVIFKARHI